jgi:hypothetical protein
MLCQSCIYRVLLLRIVVGWMICGIIVNGTMTTIAYHRSSAKLEHSIRIGSPYLDRSTGTTTATATATATTTTTTTAAAAIITAKIIFVPSTQLSLWLLHPCVGTAARKHTAAASSSTSIIMMMMMEKKE